MSVNSLNSSCKYPPVKEHDHVYIDILQTYELQFIAVLMRPIISESFRAENETIHQEGMYS